MESRLFNDGFFHALLSEVLTEDYEVVQLRIITSQRIVSREERKQFGTRPVVSILMRFFSFVV